MNRLVAKSRAIFRLKRPISKPFTTSQTQEHHEKGIPSSSFHAIDKKPDQKIEAERDRVEDGVWKKMGRFYLMIIVFALGFLTVFPLVMLSVIFAFDLVDMGKDWMESAFKEK